MRRRLQGVSILLMMVVLLSIPSAVLADGEQILMDAQVGFEGYFRMTEWTPITIEIENKGPDIRGDLEVMANQNDMAAILFSKPVVIPQNSKKRFVLNVQFRSFQKQVDVHLIQDGKTLKTLEVKKLNPMPTDQYLLGVMTEDQPALSYWGEKLGKGRIFSSYEEVQLNGDNFPEKKEILDNFAVLVINNTDTSILSAKQIEALDTWLNGGGILILGTGPNGQKTMKGLSDLLPVELGKLQEVSSIPALAAVSQKEVLGNTPFQLLGMNVKDAEEVVKTEGQVVVWRKQAGAGHIFLSAFDLGLEPVGNWAGNKMFWDVLLTGQLDPQKVQELTYPGMSMKYGDERFWGIQEALRNIRAMDLPSFTNLLIILIGYLIVVGPLNYIILKRFDKREWAWVTIPALVILFSFGIYALGYTTKGNEVITNSISVINIKPDSSSASVETFVGVFIPQKGDYTISTDKDVLLTLNSNGYYENYDPNKLDEKNRIVQAKVVQGAPSSIEFYDANVWTMRSFMMSDNLQDFGKLDTKLYYRDGKVLGTIANKSHMPLEDLVIYTPYGYQKIGNVAVGEEKQVELRVSNPAQQGKYYGNQLYQMIEQLYPDPMNSRPGGMGSLTEEERDIWAKRRIVQGVVISPLEMKMGSAGIQDQEVRMFAFCNPDLGQNVQINGTAPGSAYHSGVIMGDLKVDYQKDGIVDIPPGVFKADVNQEVSENLQTEPMGIYIDRGTALFSFDMKAFGEIDISSAAIYIGLVDGNGNAVMTVSSADGSQVLEQTLDISSGPLEIPGDTLDSFITQEGKLELKIETNGRQGVFINTPTLAIKGRVK